MKLGAKTALAIIAIFAALLAAVAAIAGTVWAILGADERAAVAAALTPHAMPSVIALIFAGAVLAILFSPLLRTHIAAPDRLGEQLRILIGPNRSHRLPLDASGLTELARSINELADQRDALQTDVERQIRDSQAKVEEERNRLATLMSELMQGIVVCNLDGRILLYNNRARLLFTATARAGGSALIGLGRSIFAAVERDLIDHALDIVRRRLQAGAPRPAANFVTTGPAGQLIRVQMAAVLANAETATDAAAPISGYVLVLDNITRAFESESRRDEVLQLLTEGSRASLANIRVAVETLTAYADMAGAERDRFIAVIDEEVQRLSARLDEAATRHADALQARWVLEEMRCSDFASAAQVAIASRRDVALRAEQINPDLWIRVDSFALIRALAYVVGRLKSEYGVENFRLRIARTERLAQLDLTWPGLEPALDALQTWDRELMRVGAETSPLTLHDVAERHDGEVWFQRDEHDGSVCRFLLPIADHEPEPTSEQPQREDRPEYYDFDLFKRSGESRALDQRQLAELTFTVFDLETTGLAPMQGDEIIQIGAVRIVNMRLLRAETFDQLVDPRRRLDPTSARVHHITDDMLRGQPTIDEVLPAFHAFCEDTVLIGHNAAFDMRFLQLKEESTGIRFHQPVLDTLLLSAVLHSAQESHRLEDIANRLGVRIAARHNALGDALVTAEVFLKMVGLLAEAGVRTLAEAREASAKTYYARLKY